MQPRMMKAKQHPCSLSDCVFGRIEAIGADFRASWYPLPDRGLIREADGFVQP